MERHTGARRPRRGSLEGGTRDNHPAHVRPRVHALLDRVPIPAHRPPYDRLILDSSGHLWIHLPAGDGEAPGCRAVRQVRHPRSLLPTDEPDRFTVMDPTGVWLGEVSVPRLEVLEIGEDYLIGVSTDEMGVESVRLHPLRRA